MQLLHRIRLHFKSGLWLGRIHITPLAKATVTSDDIFLRLALHKEGPWDGLGQQWHDCCADYPVWCEQQSWGSRALYSGGYSQDGHLILARTTPDGQSTTVLLSVEEGCDGWIDCDVCLANCRRNRELAFATLGDDS